MRLGLSDQKILMPSQVDVAHPLPFALRSTLTVHTNMPGLKHGRHEIEMALKVRPFGSLHLKVEDTWPMRLALGRTESLEATPTTTARRLYGDAGNSWSESAESHWVTW